MNKKDKIQGEALAEAYRHNQCTLALSMGIGKTYTGLKYAENYFKKGIKILIAAPKLSTQEEWQLEAKKYKKDYLLDNITFTTYLSMHRQSDTYDIIILDECHNLKFKHDNFLTAHLNNGGKILGLTGTPPDERYKTSEKYKMVSKFCPVEFTYLTENAIKDKMLNDYKIIVHCIPLSSKNDLEIQTKKVTFTTSELKSYNYYTQKLATNAKSSGMKFLRIQRMSVMKKFKSKELYAKKLFSKIDAKCILFANTKAQADSLCKHSYHSGNKNSNENLELFKSGAITKLSAVEQLSEGKNIPGLKQAIILHSYSNNRQASQKLGRTLRLNPEDTSTIHILCYKDTIDVEWVQSALNNYNKDKIKWLNK